MRLEARFALAVVLVTGSGWLLWLRGGDVDTSDTSESVDFRETDELIKNLQAKLDRQRYGSSLHTPPHGREKMHKLRTECLANTNPVYQCIASLPSGWLMLVGDSNTRNLFRTLVEARQRRTAPLIARQHMGCGA